MLDDRLQRICVPLDATIRTAMEAIDRGSVEVALVVDVGFHLRGTVTDGDIRRALLGGATLNDPVRRCMSTTPVTVTADLGRAAVLDLMQARVLSQIPIVDDAGRVVGLHVLQDLLGATPRRNSAVIMAGGRGSRLGDLTRELPKPMLKVAGRPILEHIVLHLVGSGIRRIVITVNYLAEVIERYFADGSRFGCEITYVTEDPNHPLGTAGSLAAVPEYHLDAPLIVMNGDLVTDFSVEKILAAHARNDAVATVAVRRHTYEVPFGVFDIDASQLQAVHEKPLVSWHVNAGVYVLDPSVIRRIEPGTRLDMTDLLRICVDADETVHAWELAGHWEDVGRPNQLRRAQGHDSTER